AASSSPFSYVSLRDHKRSTNNKGYIISQGTRNNKADDDGHDDSSWLPSHNPMTDDSWLPTVTLESADLCHRDGKNIVDDSWLPTVNDGKHGTNTNELDDDTDYSWLPSTFVDNNKIKPKPKNNNNNNNNNNKKNTNKNQNISTNKNESKNHKSNNNKSPQKKPRNGHWALAREVVFSCDQPNEHTENLTSKTSHSSRIKQHDTPSESTYVVESPTSGGVSSLLQRWRDLSEAKNSNKNDESSPSSTRNNSCSTGTNESKKDNSPRSPRNPNNESNSDWDSDKASRRLSCPLPSRDARDSNPGGTEKEKIRVVDIIKKLSREEELAASHAAGHVNESLPPIRTNVLQKRVEGDHNGIKSPKVPRHLIRGRQAFNNFLKQMEDHKQYELKCLVERKPVSKFPHRGRIQASLRFKILRLGAEPKPETNRHRRCISKTLESNNRLDIMDLRERFNSGVQNGATDSTKPKRNDIRNTNNEETPSSAAKDVDVKIKTKTATTNKKQEYQPKIEALTNQSTKNSTSSGKDVVHKAKFVDSSSNSLMFKEDKFYIDENKISFHEDEGQFMSARTSYSQIEDRGFSDFEEGNYSGNKQGLESFNDWIENGYSQTPSDLDGGESYDMQLFDTNYDWVSEISRPKSDWEDMRLARYQEMRHHSSGNEDIQRLLERKSVSSFLGSGLRDLIDQLMVTRIEQSHVQVEKKDIVRREKGDSMKEMGQEHGSMVDEDGDRWSRIETKCSEYSERPWRPNDVINNSETTSRTSPSTSGTTTSPSLEHSLSSGRSHNNSTPQSPFPNTHQTIKMELIYDLKGHMEQLHQEIMELRKSIKSCVNMQVKMQQSLKQNAVAASATCPAQKKERNTHGFVKYNCFICRVMQVDSLLYRCGHMCACFKCAVEMQRTSGECPICEAPIVDIVKAFAHEN
ncbi:hypothetical protein M8C21_020176, partial [Ambrosia artemisiifolia]